MSDESASRSAFLRAGTLAALTLSMQPLALAQDEPASDDLEVVVSGSRVVRNGFSAPTPVTVLGVDELTAGKATNLADALDSLPSLSNSTTRNSIGGSTSLGPGSFLNLRGLGSNRTLILFDGRRAGPTTTSGATDINLIPPALVSRVDIVTGGASAAYGSDAVAGVVNFVLDKGFRGWKGELSGGVTEIGDVPKAKASLAWGADFLDGRGYVLAAADFFDAGGIPNNSRDRDFLNQRYALMNNPAVTTGNPASATNPRSLIMPDFSLPYASDGGLITNTALAGTTFAEGGVPMAFQFGTLRSSTGMVGGDGSNFSHTANYTSPITTKNAFLHSGFEITPNITAFAQALIGENSSDYVQTPAYQYQGTAFTIFQDNAFLPASIRQRMIDGNIPSFTMGRVDMDWPFITAHNGYRNHDITAGLDGSFGDGWNWSTYVGHTQSVFELYMSDEPIISNVFNAADAVVDPTTGRVVCNSTLANPNNGCVPINLFGPNSASQAALDYIMGTLWNKSKMIQDVVAFNMDGEPFEGWAGPISVGFGAEYRKLSGRSYSDAISQSLIATAGIRGMPASYLTAPVGGFQTNNPQPLAGEYDITEGYFETLVPLLSEAAFAKSLDFNAAVRLTEYSTSGAVTTWKAGLTWQPVNDVRFRATRSRDIRAPNISELFTGVFQQITTVRDPQNGNAIATANTLRSGNLDLEPEEADTTTFGVVYQPSFVPNLSISVDYYDIEIAGAISTPNTQDIVTRCFEGAADQCALVHRTPAGILFQIDVPSLNLQQLKATGLDLELGYRIALGKGEIGLRTLGSYVSEFSTTSPIAGGVSVIDRAGDIGNSSQPKWRWTAMIDYQQGPFGLALQGRFIGDGKYNSTYTELDLNDNTIPSAIFVDLSTHYNAKLGDTAADFFLSVNNLLDRDPPIIPATGYTQTQTNLSLYDVEGRAYMAGVRFRF
jgi:iron complex outermembrane receptor protein